LWFDVISKGYSTSFCNATRFRKDLLKDGFGMMQFSAYNRHCASKVSAEVHVNRVKSFIPEKGQVSILQLTDKQYGNIINFWVI
jgi:CRISPR-associated protein Cas2